MNRNINFFLAILFYSSFSNAAVYCSDKFDMYKLWPISIKPFTKLVTEVCCERNNSQVPLYNDKSNVLTLKIHMKLGSSIKIRNLSLGVADQAEIVCDEELKGKECLAFYSINDNKYAKAREYPGNPGLLLRVYDFDVESKDIKISDGDLPFFRFSKIRGEVKVVGASKSNLSCQAKRTEKTNTANSPERSGKGKGSSGDGSGNRKKPILEDQHVSVLEDNPA